MAKAMRWWATRDDDGKVIWVGTEAEKPRMIDGHGWCGGRILAMQSTQDITLHIWDEVIRVLFPHGVRKGQCVELRPPERFQKS